MVKIRSSSDLKKTVPQRIKRRKHAVLTWQQAWVLGLEMSRSLFLVGNDSLRLSLDRRWSLPSLLKVSFQLGRQGWKRPLYLCEITSAQCKVSGGTTLRSCSWISFCMQSLYCFLSILTTCFWEPHWHDLNQEAKTEKYDFSKSSFKPLWAGCVNFFGKN